MTAAKAPERITADVFKNFNLSTLLTVKGLIEKLSVYLNIRIISSTNSGIEPINLEIIKTKIKLVYIILSLKRIEGVFLLYVSTT